MAKPALQRTFKPEDPAVAVFDWASSELEAMLGASRRSTLLAPRSLLLGPYCNSCALSVCLRAPGSSRSFDLTFMNKTMSEADLRAQRTTFQDAQLAPSAGLMLRLT